MYKCSVCGASLLAASVFKRSVRCRSCGTELESRMSVGKSFVFVFGAVGLFCLVLWFRHSWAYWIAFSILILFVLVMFATTPLSTKRTLTLREWLLRLSPILV